MSPKARIGTDNPKCKLSEDDVRAIRRSPEPQKVLAERYGVGRDTIWAIRARQTWRHIDAPSDIPPTDTQPGEEWRAVTLPGYNRLYEVSNLGRVRRSDARLPRPIRRVNVYPRGYVFVVLSKNNQQLKALLHRLVAGAFIGPHPHRKRSVNHKDGDKTNNRSDNLEYVTAKENTAHAIRIGLISFTGERNPKAKLTNADIIAIRESTDISRIAAARYGVSKSTIDRVRQRRLWTHVPTQSAHR